MEQHRATSATAKMYVLTAKDTNEIMVEERVVYRLSKFEVSLWYRHKIKKQNGGTILEGTLQQ